MKSRYSRRSFSVMLIMASFSRAACRPGVVVSSRMAPSFRYSIHSSMGVLAISLKWLTRSRKYSGNTSSGMVMRLALSLMYFSSLGVFSCSTESFFVMPRKVVTPW